MSKDERRRYLILKDSNIYKGLLLLAIPLMLNNLARTFHDLVDTYFVSRIPGYGKESIAAIQITFPITFVYISIGFGLSIAGTALISQFRGANLFKEAKKYASQLILIAAVIGIILNILSYFLSPLLMRMVGAEGYILENSSAYLQIRSFELTFLLIFFAFSAIRQSSGDTITPVILGLWAIVINVILTPLLVINMGLGVTGAAYATVIGNLAIMPFGFYLLFRSKNGVTISLKYLKPKIDIIKKLITTALPASLGMALTAVGFYVLNIVIFSYGTETVAAFSTGNRISSIFLHPVMAIGGVMAAYIGQNIGNLNPERAKEAYLKGLIASVVIMIMGSLVGIMIRGWAAGLFLGAPEDAAAKELAITYMLFLFSGLPLMAVYQAHVGAFNGNGKTMYTFWLGTIRLWMIRIPFIYAFKLFTDLGSSGIWYAMLISNFLIAFIGFGMMRRIKFKPKINLEPQLT